MVALRACWRLMMLKTIYFAFRLALPRFPNARLRAVELACLGSFFGLWLLGCRAIDLLDVKAERDDPLRERTHTGSVVSDSAEDEARPSRLLEDLEVPVVGDGQDQGIP